ncbi:MAG: putative glycoside hydrolase [Nitrospirota bacterium]|nr:putative glycoside hydrolase [Nitrospirota bacterium]
MKAVSKGIWIVASLSLSLAVVFATGSYWAESSTEQSPAPPAEHVMDAIHGNVKTEATRELTPNPMFLPGFPQLVPLAGRSRDMGEIYVKGLYVSSWTAGTKRIQEFIQLAKQKEINALVIDLKDSTGKICYESNVPLVQELKLQERRIRDLDALVRECKKAGIYLIARIAVFQDPALAEKRPEWAIKSKEKGTLWRDKKGLAWVDPSVRKIWEYNVAIAREAIEKGFDEINFDYIRFPTDGKMDDLAYPHWDSTRPKYENMKAFFEYIDKEVRSQGVFLSVDLFGLTTWQKDDLNIGQRLIDAAGHVDYICPMVYPSHYPSGFLGYKNPALYPYEVVYKSIAKGMETIKGTGTKIRPWLQDFDIGADYDSHKIMLQKKAVYDANAYGWLMWNARNVYTLGGLEPKGNKDGVRG